MDFNKLSSPSLKDLFVKEIERMILSGQLKVGDKLPPERELAQQMSVSRTVVSSGLAELSNRGFVDIIPRVGALVADFHRKGTVETLNAILRYKGGVLSDSEMKSLMEIRLVIENLAIDQAVEGLTDEDLATLQGLIDVFEECKDPVSGSEAIFNFHHELCILSGNSLVPVVFYSFKELSTAMWVRYFGIHGMADLVANTKRLYRCLEQRDKVAALASFGASLNSVIDGPVSIYHNHSSH